MNDVQEVVRFTKGGIESLSYTPARSSEKGYCRRCDGVLSKGISEKVIGYSQQGFSYD